MSISTEGFPHAQTEPQWTTYTELAHLRLTKCRKIPVLDWRVSGGSPPYFLLEDQLLRGLWVRALIQRVLSAEVRVKDEAIARIGHGLLFFLGIGRGDGEQQAHALIDKIIHLRIFENEAGKFDRSLLDVHGEALVVSQFTLYGDCHKGRRPSFTGAASPEEAAELYKLFIHALRQRGIRVASGSFAQRMQVHLINDGPVTIWLEVPPTQQAQHPV
jgi:D-tyrosyl-tRNA(Tyr) deacylase